MENPFEAKPKRKTNNAKEIAKLNKQTDRQIDKPQFEQKRNVEDDTTNKDNTFWQEMNEKYGSTHHQLLDILQKVDEWKWYIIIFSTMFTDLSYVVIPCVIFIRKLTKWFFEKFIDSNF